LPEERLTVKKKSRVEFAAKGGELGGVVFALKQKKFPFPSHPIAFKPPDISVKPEGGVALRKFVGGLNAIAFTPERPPSVSDPPLIPVMWRSKLALVPLVVSNKVYVMPSAIKLACAGVAAIKTPSAAAIVTSPSRAGICVVTFIPLQKRVTDGAKAPLYPHDMTSSFRAKPQWY
jgi:hypothetical protein